MPWGERTVNKEKRNIRRRKLNWASVGNEIEADADDHTIKVTIMNTQKGKCCWAECKTQTEFGIHRSFSTLSRRHWSSWCLLTPQPTFSFSYINIYLSAFLPNSTWYTISHYNQHHKVSFEKWTSITFKFLRTLQVFCYVEWNGRITQAVQFKKLWLPIQSLPATWLLGQPSYVAWWWGDYLITKSLTVVAPHAFHTASFVSQLQIQALLLIKVT